MIGIVSINVTVLVKCVMTSAVWNILPSQFVVSDVKSHGFEWLCDNFHRGILPLILIDFYEIIQAHLNVSVISHIIHPRTS
jgi:hypothetical protein